MDLEAVTADEFSFLKDEKSSMNETIIPVNQSNRETRLLENKDCDQEWLVDRNRIKQMTEIYRSEKERKRTSSTSSTETADTAIDFYSTDRGRKPTVELNPGLGGLDDINIKDNFVEYLAFLHSVCCFRWQTLHPPSGRSVSLFEVIWTVSELCNSIHLNLCLSQPAKACSRRQAVLSRKFRFHL